MTKIHFRPEQVLDLWFPDDGFWENEERFSAWVRERMYGGMDETICRDFANLTTAAARGELDQWSDTDAASQRHSGRDQSGLVSADQRPSSSRV